MQAFLEVVKSDFEQVNQFIIDHLHSDVPLVENIGHYIVDSGGKRLRPILVLLTAKAMGYDKSAHINLAAVIEFIHTATLLHDDVVDISAMRRGKPTANEKWGNAPSVLVGDFLYSRAFQIMVALERMPIMKVLSHTTNIIAEGEVQQLANAKNPDITEQDYLTVIHKKTAALFESACETAAILAGGDQNMQTTARKYGYHLGLAFQLIDDSLDYEGDSETLGKNVGDDLAEGKPTLPLIHAITHSNEQERNIIRDAIKSGDVSKLQEIVDIVTRSGSLDYAKQQANTHAQEAIATIQTLPESPYKKAMSELAEFAVKRAY